jgi:hypothetical protein
MARRKEDAWKKACEKGMGNVSAPSSLTQIEVGLGSALQPTNT